MSETSITSGVTIERVGAPDDAMIRALTEVLMDAVDSGAGVSFMSNLTRATAEAWWRATFAGLSPRSSVLVARDVDGVVGTVQVHASWAPNQPHRGDIAKLIVHRRVRGRGVARAWMREAERVALAHEITLLLLDTCKGGAAERLYESLGWTRVGEVPHFALNPDGSWCDTVCFYKHL